MDEETKKRLWGLATLTLICLTVIAVTWLVTA